MMDYKVLIVSFSNSEVDMMLSKLKQSGFDQFIRIASSVSSVSKDIQE
jgi:hypothetical protein